MKTPIEYLIEKLTESEHLWVTDKPSEMEELSVIIQNAKKMEKQQMGEIWDAALDTFEKRGRVKIRAWEDFDDYFDNKFKTKNK